MLGDSKHYARPVVGEKGLNRWRKRMQERMRLRRKGPVGSGMLTSQSPAIINPVSSPESIELFSVSDYKGDYQQVNLTDDGEDELTAGSSLTRGKRSEEGKRSKSPK